MEDFGEVQTEGNKVSLDNNKKRRLKTPAQVTALENFYNEHKYPSEEMKIELAQQIGLTEKQISGWFCHRRLKDKRLLRDEAHACGRQDRSGSVPQDRGSGLRQDSCGSTKQGDYRTTDPREVESRRLYGHNFSGADLSYDHKGAYQENTGCMDSTSSENSSSLQDKFLSQREDAYDMETSRYLKQHMTIMSVDAKVTKSVGYKPSGYLKVKGEIENAAVTAVKRQLGRNYQEDGPPLGVDFDSLPPGAFESPSSYPVNQPTYVGDSRWSHSPDVSGFLKRPSLGPRYEVHNSKMNSQDSYIESANHSTMHGSGSQDMKSLQHLKRKSPLNFPNPLPGQKTSLEIYEDSARETFLCNSNRSRISSKHGAEGMRSDSVSKHHGLYDGSIAGEQSRVLPHDYDNVSSKIVRKSEYLSAPSNVVLGCSKSPDTEERETSTVMAKVEKHYGERKSIKKSGDPVRVKMHPVNELTVAKQVRVEFPRQDYGTKASYAEMSPPKCQIKGSAVEMPSSFSEDETAETSSSMG